MDELTQIRLPSPNDQVVVIRHQDPGMEFHIELLHPGLQQFDPMLPVRVSLPVCVSEQAGKISRRSLPRAVTWYTAPGYSTRNGLAISSTVYSIPIPPSTTILSSVVEFSKAEFLERAKAESWISSAKSVGKENDR